MWEEIAGDDKLLESDKINVMQINVSPALMADDAELLEDELDSIADQMGFEGIDIAGVVEDDENQISSLEIFYEDSEKPDDMNLKTIATKILAEFTSIQNSGSSTTRAFKNVHSRMGVIRLVLVS